MKRAIATPVEDSAATLNRNGDGPGYHHSDPEPLQRRDTSCVCDDR
jgi:hypothetical protein